jgi:hypothetical protein
VLQNSLQYHNQNNRQHHRLAAQNPRQDRPLGRPGHECVVHSACICLHALWPLCISLTVLCWLYFYIITLTLSTHTFSKTLEPQG